MPTEFPYLLMKICWGKNAKLSIKTIPGSFFEMNFDVSNFLQDATFPQGNYRRKFQVIIRENVYRILPPITSRNPIWIEQDGVDYYYHNMEDIIRESDNGIFLERGEYRGVSYGTHCPAFCRNRGIPPFFVDQWDSLSKPKRRMSFKKAIGMVPENSSKRISDYDLEGYGSDVRKSL